MNELSEDYLQESKKVTIKKSETPKRICEDFPKKFIKKLLKEFSDKFFHESLEQVMKETWEKFLYDYLEGSLRTNCPLYPGGVSEGIIVIIESLKESFVEKVWRNIPGAI